MNRRDFLRSTAAAGAAVVAAPLVAMAGQAVSAPESGLSMLMANDNAIFGTGIPNLMRDYQREYDRQLCEYYARWDAATQACPYQ